MTLSSPHFSSFYITWRAMGAMGAMVQWCNGAMGPGKLFYSLFSSNNGWRESWEQGNGIEGNIGEIIITGKVPGRGTKNS